jgi:hypothetical protein
VAQILACHPNGHVREAALRTFAVASDGREVGFLLLRVNDWVEPVRRAAVAALRARRRAELAPALVAALPLLGRMRAWRRLDERGLLDELDAIPSPGDLAAGLASTDVAVRRTCARRLAAGDLDDAAIERALADRDVPTRRTVARQLCAEAGARFDAHAARLLADRAGVIRREALAVALRRGSDAAPFLVDPDAGVRGLAQAHLILAGDDVAARYRAMLGGGTSRIRAIALDALADAVTVRAHLADADPRLRAAALGASARARLDDLHDVLLAGLADVAPAPRRVARRLLVPRAMRLRPAAVWAVFSAAPHARLAALAVLHRCDYWPRLPYLLRATSPRRSTPRSPTRRSRHTPRARWQPRLPPRRRHDRDAADHARRVVVALTNDASSFVSGGRAAVASRVHTRAAWLIREPS